MKHLIHEVIRNEFHLREPAADLADAFLLCLAVGAEGGIAIAEEIVEQLLKMEFTLADVDLGNLMVDLRQLNRRGIGADRAAGDSLLGQVRGCRDQEVIILEILFKIGGGGVACINGDQPVLKVIQQILPDIGGDGGALHGIEKDPDLEILDQLLLDHPQRVDQVYDEEADLLAGKLQVQLLGKAVGNVEGNIEEEIIVQPDILDHRIGYHDIPLDAQQSDLDVLEEVKDQLLLRADIQAVLASDIREDLQKKRIDRIIAGCRGLDQDLLLLKRNQGNCSAHEVL